MLRIAVVTQIFPVREQPYRGHSVYQTVRALSKVAQVSVFAPVPEYPSWLLPRTRSWARTDTGYSPEGVNATYVPFPALPYISRVVNGMVAAHRLRSRVEEFNPDVILGYWLYPDGYAALRLARALGIPVAVKAIGSDMNRRTDPVSMKLRNSVLKKSDMVLTVSEDLRSKVVKSRIAEHRVRTIHNGCDANVFRRVNRSEARGSLSLPDNIRLVLYVGRFDVYKGLRELLLAVNRLRHSMPDLLVAFMGEGPAEPELRRRSSALGLEQHVLFMPPAASSTVSTWMGAADVVTLPSYSEGCPNVVIEALSCGRPVVATEVGGIPELVTASCGLLVPPRSSDELAEGLRFVLSRDWDDAAISEQHRRSWADVASDTLEVCSELVHTARARSSARTVDSEKEPIGVP